MADVTYEPGVFQKFRTTTHMHLGGGVVDIPKNAVLEFDGQSVKYAGKEYSSPATAGAVRIGWLVPAAEENVGDYIPKAAGVMLSPAANVGHGEKAAPKMVTVSSDEDVVGSLTATAAKREAARVANSAPNPNAQRPAAPRSVEPAPAVTAPPPPSERNPAPPQPKKFPLVYEDSDVAPREFKKIGAKEPQHGVVNVDQKNDEIILEDEDFNAEQTGGDDEQGGVTVARIKSPTAVSFSSDPQDLRDMTQKLEFSKPPQIQKMANRPAPRTINADAEEGVPIKKNLPNGATGDVAEVRSGDSLEELLPNATSSGTPAPQASSSEFQWDKSGHWRDRVKRALEQYGDNPQALESIRAVESKVMVSHLGAALSKRPSR